MYKTSGCCAFRFAVCATRHSVPSISFLLLLLRSSHLSTSSIFVRVMTLHSSDVVKLCDGTGTESVNMDSGSVAGGDKLRFLPPFSGEEYIWRYNNS